MGVGKKTAPADVKELKLKLIVASTPAEMEIAVNKFFGDTQDGLVTQFEVIPVQSLLMAVILYIQVREGGA
jgi:hypothetical protein